MPHPILLMDSFLRKVLDFVVAVVGLIFLSPLLLLVGSIIKGFDQGPIFYRARRVGKAGKLFYLYKFRTMVVATNEGEQGPAITAKGDARITPIGSWLRRTKVDELPQLLNVLRGEMSLVGPRPEDPRYVALYNDEQRQVLLVRPGITSAASLAYRHEERLLVGDNWEAIYREEVMPAKLAIDLTYLKRRTVWTDILLILRTVFAIFD